MKNFRLFLTVAALSMWGVASYAMEHDIRQLQARLAEQEARLGDLQAKMAQTYAGQSDDPEGIISLRKNATVTIGGLVSTKYTATSGKRKSNHDFLNEDDALGEYRTRLNTKTASLEVSDAELHVQIDVNDHFEAFLLMNLHDGVDANDSGGIAEQYWMRWKDICNSGFSLLVGRAPLVFGEGGIGELGSYAAGSGDGIGEVDWGQDISAIPEHNVWDVSRVNQATGAWEGLDGKLSLELSLMNHVYEDTGYNTGRYHRIKDGVYKERSRNYGVGTMSARISYTPIEDLKFTLSAANYRANGLDVYDDSGNSYNYGADWLLSKNNTVYGLAVGWRPAFFNRLYTWGQWVHGNDVYFMDGVKSDAINFGVSFDLTERMTWFAQGDFLTTRYHEKFDNTKAKAWAFYTGLQYSLDYGVSFEAGWKHERITAREADEDGVRSDKIRANTIYGLVGFEF